MSVINDGINNKSEIWEAQACNLSSEWNMQAVNVVVAKVNGDVLKDEVLATTVESGCNFTFSLIMRHIYTPTASWVYIKRLHLV